jgi:type IV pilus assembly protein PilC
MAKPGITQATSAKADKADKVAKAYKAANAAKAAKAAKAAMLSKAGASSARKPHWLRHRITAKDLCLFTRQFATMLKAGLPLLQAFDIVARGHANPALSRLALDIRADVETGTSLSQAFRRYPQYFDGLFCHLVAAGEQAGMLEPVLSRLATYQEKSLALRSQVKSAMFYPAAVLAVAVVVTAVMLVWVVPAFKQVFDDFGAELPLPTLIVMALSEALVEWWPVLVGVIVAGSALLYRTWRRSASFRAGLDRLMLRLPLLGKVVTKAVVARWCSTLATMFAAGVPLVESLNSVAGAAGNAVYHEATQRVASSVRSGTSLSVALQQTQVFPVMLVQMVAIGEESGSLDDMLRKVAEFYESEVDAAVASLSSLLEPLIMVVLGTLIGGLVIAMYLPIFQLGSVI